MTGQKPPHDIGGGSQPDSPSHGLQNLSAMGVTGAEWSAELSKGGAKGVLVTMEDARLAILGGMGETAADVQTAFEAGLSDNTKS